ncbi:MAG: T9SS type A sorting domain-containing protein [Balneolaceae bacterium]
MNHLQEDHAGAALEPSGVTETVPKEQTLKQESTDQHLIVDLDKDSRTLSLTTTPLFYEENIQLRLRVYDPEGLSSRRDYQITVNHVNDPPSPVALLFPANNDTIPVNQVKFEWSESTTLENEPISYSLSVLREDGLEFTVDELTDTTWVAEEMTTFFEPHMSYEWQVTSSDGEDETAGLEQFDMVTMQEVPLVYDLKQNYANPFRSSTTIVYWVPVRSEVVITVYDMLGRRVETLVDEQSLIPGTHEKVWNAGGLASGVYFYRMVAKGENASRFMKVQQMTLIK